MLLRKINSAIGHMLGAIKSAQGVDSQVYQQFKLANAHLNAAKRNARLGELSIARNHLIDAQVIIGIELTIANTDADIARALNMGV